MIWLIFKPGILVPEVAKGIPFAKDVPENTLAYYDSFWTESKNTTGVLLWHQQEDYIPTPEQQLQILLHT